jgi:hypothetical protein
VNVLPDSYPRLAHARELTAGRHGRLDVDAMQDVLRDHANEPDSICRHKDLVRDPEGKRLQSVFSVIMDLMDALAERVAARVLERLEYGQMATAGSTRSRRPTTSA